MPSLRNIALTAPYMHDGRFATLNDVLEHYSHVRMAAKQADELCPDVPTLHARGKAWVLANKGFRVFEGVKIVGKTGTKTEWNPVDEKVSDNRIRFRTIGLYHDATNGMQRGKNSAWIVDVDGLTFMHLGDLGHTLSAEQVKAIGTVDVLMVPVGGIYTLNGEQAKTVVERLRPRLFVVPMHFGVPGFDDLLGPDEFLDSPASVKKLKGNELTIPVDAKADARTVVLMNWKKEEPPAPPKK